VQWGFYFQQDSANNQKWGPRAGSSCTKAAPCNQGIGVRKGVVLFVDLATSACHERVDSSDYRLAYYSKGSHDRVAALVNDVCVDMGGATLDHCALEERWGGQGGALQLVDVRMSGDCGGWEEAAKQSGHRSDPQGRVSDASEGAIRVGTLRLVDWRGCAG
jgi:hypothetical protein